MSEMVAEEKGVEEVNNTASCHIGQYIWVTLGVYEITWN